MARPQIPKPIAAVVWAQAEGRCKCCGEKVLAGMAEIDHRPPLALRQRVAGLADTDPAAYVPHANDPRYLDLLHGARSGKDCHKRRTFGEGTRRGDASDIAKSKRIAPEHEAMQRRLLSKATGDDHDKAPAAQPKAKMTSRPMPCGRKSKYKRTMAGKVVLR